MTWWGWPIPKLSTPCATVTAVSVVSPVSVLEPVLVLVSVLVELELSSPLLLVELPLELEVPGSTPSVVSVVELPVVELPLEPLVESSADSESLPDDVVVLVGSGPVPGPALVVGSTPVLVPAPVLELADPVAIPSSPQASSGSARSRARRFMRAPYHSRRHGAQARA